MQKTHSQKGLSTLELLISMLILSLITAIAMNFIFASTKSTTLVTLEAKLKSNTESGLNRLSRSLAQSRRMFGQPNTGQNPLLSRIQVPTNYRVIPDSKLPVIREAGSLSPDKNCVNSSESFFLSNSVGNSLLYLEVVNAFDGFPTLPQPTPTPPATMTLEPRKIDIYTLNYVYITDRVVSGQSQNPRFANTSLPAQNLVHWVSVPVADYRQLLAYRSAFSSQHNTINSTLINNAYRSQVTYAIDLEATNINNTFYLIAGNGNLTVQSTPSFRLPQASISDALRLQSNQSEVFTIAYNTHNNESFAGFFPIRNQVPFFYNATLTPPCPTISPQPTPSPAGDFAFPRGFETMIAGPSSGRTVLMRATVAVKGNHPRVAEQVHTVTTYVRDL